MTEVTITYETLYEFLRREKNKEELQELDNDFLDNVIQYLRDKNKILNDPKEGIFGAEESRKVQTQLINVKTILTELYNRREKKIINAALDESKTGTSLINTAVMLPKELSLYHKLVEILQLQRSNILLNTLAMKSSLISVQNIIKQLRVDDEYVEKTLPARIEILIERIKKELPVGISRDHIDDIEDSAEKGLHKLAKYQNSIKNMLKSLKNAIKDLPRSRKQSEQIKHIKNMAAVIRDGYIYEDPHLKYLFDKIERLNELLVALIPERKLVESLIAKEYQYV